MTNDAEAQKAITGPNGKDVEGRTLNVMKLVPRPSALALAAGTVGPPGAAARYVERRVPDNQDMGKQTYLRPSPRR
jgi:hypothetical protein